MFIDIYTFDYLLNQYEFNFLAMMYFHCNSINIILHGFKYIKIINAEVIVVMDKFLKYFYTNRTGLL